MTPSPARARPAEDRGRGDGRRRRRAREGEGRRGAPPRPARTPLFHPGVPPAGRRPPPAPDLAARAATDAGRAKEAAQFHQRALAIDPMSEQDWEGLTRALNAIGDPRARLAAQREAWWAVDLD